MGRGYAHFSVDHLAAYAGKLHRLIVQEYLLLLDEFMRIIYLLKLLASMQRFDLALVNYG